MSYLARLKQKILQDAPSTVPTKPTEGGSQQLKGAFVGFVGYPPAPLQNNSEQWAEFEALLAIVAPAYDTPAHEYDWAREAARGDLAAALIAYRAMAKEIEVVRK